MTSERKIFLLFLAAGACTAVLDSAVGSFFFHKGPFLETARKYAENALAVEREKLRLLYDNSPDAVVILDTEKRILYANRKAGELVGGPPRR